MSLDEKSQKLGQTLAAIKDAFQGFQRASEAIDNFLNFLGKELEPPKSSANQGQRS